MANGLVLGWQLGLGHSRENAVVIAAQVDGLLFALPVLLGYEWVAH